MSDIRSRAVPAQVRPQPPYVSPSASLVRGVHYAAGSVMDEAIRASTPRESSYLRERYEALQCALTQPCVASHKEPGELVSWANQRGITRQAMHAKAKGEKSQRAMGERIARAFEREANIMLGTTTGEFRFVVIVLTRISPRPLDSDNLERAFKHIRDGIAAGLGIDDRLPIVRYQPSQERGRPREHLVRAQLHIQPKEQVR